LFGAGARCGPHAGGEGSIGERRGDVIAECLRVVHRGEKPGDPMLDDVGNAAGASRGNRLTEKQRIEENRAESFFPRAEHDDVRRSENRVGVVAIAGQVQRIR
jgi:hypothetical protein